MDYGIRGRRAIVCAASQGLGKGCAIALAQRRASTSSSTRATQTRCKPTAAEIRAATGVTVTAVAADVTTPEGRSARCSLHVPAPDILVNNAGGPPIGDFRDWDEAEWQKAVNDNMITPIMLIRAVVDGMIAPALRSHRQHHVTGGEGAARTSRTVQRVREPASPVSLRALRARLPSTTSPSTTCCPGHSPPTRQTDGLRKLRCEGGTGLRNLRARRRWRQCPPTASAHPKSSVARAPFCAALIRATSSARTC